MVKNLRNLVAYLFYLLIFFVPFILYPKTSELFEFNKMVLTYLLCVLIVGIWIIRMVFEKRIIFRKTPLDIPLLIFLASQILSTLISIDKRTSLLGYYSRFHGGLVSTITYLLLYWAFVSNMNFNSTKKTLSVLLSSAVFVSIWAILEHLGRSFSCLIFPDFGTFDTSCWVQDVQHRVFATLGQPNWLAAWLAALIPITWAFALVSRKVHRILAVFVSLLFFLAFLYTRSRSGILGFTIGSFTFWIPVLTLTLFDKKIPFLEKKSNITISALAFLVILIPILLVGTPWTPKLIDFLGKSDQIESELGPDINAYQGPALEVGGTESGKIRQIVWQGAINIWKHYPLVGSGVETFAYSYYQFRPVAHNLVSEWDYLYNKAHNEYLNFAATTGSLGLLSYLLIPLMFSYWAFKIITNNPISTNNTNKKLEIGHLKLVIIGIYSGYVSILVTNFFGFSVVPVALQFLLYPAMAITLVTSEKSKVTSYEKITVTQKFSIAFILLVTCYLLLLIGKYWRADLLYAKGKYNNDSANYAAARETLLKAVSLSPKEAVYWIELADSTTSLAVSLAEEDKILQAQDLAQIAFSESQRAENLSPYDVNIKRKKASLLVKLSVIEENFLLFARDTLKKAVELAPTDAKLFYNFSLAHLRTGDYNEAIKVMEKTTQLKPDYADAHYALALMYIDVGEKDKARSELEFILTNIDPQNSRAKRELEELGF